MNKRLLFVLSFYHGDVQQALDLLTWIKELGGCRDNRCLIVTEYGANEKHVYDVMHAAREAFADVECVQCTHSLPDEKWPIGPNWQFETACRHIETKIRMPFLWCEPDCVPLKPGWLAQIEREYFACGKPFLGSVLALKDPGQPPAYLNGAGVYPANPWFHYSRFLGDKSRAWDLVSAQHVVPKATNSPLFHHFWGQEKLPPTFKFKREPDDPINTLGIADLPKHAVFFHRCKDGSLIRLLRQIRCNEPKTFYHSGDLGDIIYSLPAVRYLGGGTLLLGPCRSGAQFQTREPMTPERAAILIPLLKEQPYIIDARFASSPDGVDVDLNEFRRGVWKDNHENLCYIHLKTFAVPFTEADRSWIQVRHPLPFADRPVVIARSGRYHSDFDWKRMLSMYEGKIVFLGTDTEHSSFCDEFKTDVLFFRTKTLLEVARAIAGAKLFIGNQSSPYAIAEGMKKNTVQETWPGAANCIFERPGASYSWRPRGKTTPIVTPKIETNTRKLDITFRAVIDGWTGLGQIACATAVGLKAMGHNLQLTPTRLDTRFGGAPFAVTKLREVFPDVKNLNLIFEDVDGVKLNLTPGAAAFTMWESSVWPKEAVDAMADAARVVIVPNRWNADCLKEQGLDVQIEVCNLCVDTDVYTPQGTQPTNTFMFGAAGRPSHGESRKNLAPLIVAFKEAFPNAQNVQLNLKVFDDDPLPVLNDSRIKVENRFMTDRELARWYSQNQVFISPSRGEGWGLHLHQAMACGCCPVACAYSGQAEFFDETVGIPLEFKEVPATELRYAGVWAEPSIESMVSAMRQTYENPALAQSFGRAASYRAREFTRERYLRRLESILLDL